MLDFTTFWAFFKKNDNKTGQIVIMVAMFATGWYFGHITSPYSSATPIVFNDRECSACNSSGGTTSQLQALKAEGEPQVASATTQGSTEATSSQKDFVSSVNSDLYHHKSCPSASRIKEENQEWFATSQEAKSAGLTPSKCTQELGY